MSETSPVTSVNEPLENSGGNGGKFAFKHRRIGPAIGMQRLACSVYEVPAGKRACPYHAHSVIEEAFLILEGSGTLRYDNSERPIKAGDIIATPVGKAHQIINTSDKPLKYLALSTNEATDVVLYPDSKKIQVYSDDFEETLFHMTKLDDAVDYYHGED